MSEKKHEHEKKEETTTPAPPDADPKPAAPSTSGAPGDRPPIFPAGPEPPK